MSGRSNLDTVKWAIYGPLMPIGRLAARLHKRTGDPIGSVWRRGYLCPHDSRRLFGLTYVDVFGYIFLSGDNEETPRLEAAYVVHGWSWASL